MSKSNREWADNEKRALDMTLQKMTAHFMTHDYKPKSNSGLSQKDVNDMFKAYHDHYRHKCHSKAEPRDARYFVSRSLDNLEEAYNER